MLKTYDPALVSIVLGAKPVTGIADGTFIGVERNADTWQKTVGAGGEVTRAKSNDKSGRFTLTLMAGSEANIDLSAYATADELGGTSTFPVIIKDNSGNSLYTAATCWLVKPANASFGKDAGDTREWIIDTDELIMYSGGN